MKTILSVVVTIVKLVCWIMLLLFVVCLLFVRHIFRLSSDIQREIMN